MIQQLTGIRAFVRRIGIRKMAADIPQRRRAEQRVHQRLSLIHILSMRTDA